MLVVITGSIWAKASWGTWWVWSDPRLVTFLIVLLLYAAYFVLRSSAEGERRFRYSAIYAIAAFASVPLSFYSVRVARSFVHPVVFTQRRRQHAGHDARLVRGQPARGDRRLPHGPAARAASSAAPTGPCAGSKRRLEAALS